MTYKQHTENDDGYCDWETPVMEGYKMACCDCGLVHEVDFGVLEIEEHLPNGDWKAVELPKDKYRVQMRMKRNNRSTGQMRRHM